MREHKRLSRLEKNWDIRKLTPIVLVPHPEEHIFAVADGQGRCIVAKNKGMDRLTATILMDAPDDPEERLKFEAEYFINQDAEVEAVKPYEKHCARVIIGDESAITLEKLLKKYDVKFVNTKGRREGAVLGSYTDTYAIAKTHGEECLDFILSIIDNAGWHKEPNGYSACIMRSLKEIWVAHPLERKKIHSYLSKYLRKIDPVLLNSSARANYPKRDWRMACVLYLEDVVCNALGIDRVIYIEDNKKVYKKVVNG